MSQTAVMVRVSGNLIPEVFCSVPDEEDVAIRMKKMLPESVKTMDMILQRIASLTSIS